MGWSEYYISFIFLFLEYLISVSYLGAASFYLPVNGSQARQIWFAFHCEICCISLRSLNYLHNKTSRNKWTKFKEKTALFGHFVVEPDDKLFILFFYSDYSSC